MIKPFLKPLGIALFVVAFGLIVWVNRTGRFDPRPYEEKGTLVPVTKQTTFPPKSIPVSCGVHVEEISDFSVQTLTFSAEGSVWLIWPSAFQAILNGQSIPPDQILTAVNATQASDFSLHPEKSFSLPDGRIYQRYRFSGQFYASGLDFRHFPFEALDVPLIFGLNSENPALNVGNAHLVADAAQSGLGEYTDIPGYINTGQHLEEEMYQFPSRFGLPTGNSETETRYSRVQMNAVYHSAAIAAILQLILPLVVVMTILLLAPNLTGSLWNVRTAIPPSILLALIFQEQAYRTKLPPLPYLTFMDQMYAASFAIALVVFGLFVWTSNKLDQATPEDRQAVVDQINRIDLRFQIGLTCALIAAAIISWFLPVPLR